MLNSEAQTALKQVLARSRSQTYSGYAAHDALNSPFLHGLTLHQRFLRRLLIQGMVSVPGRIRNRLGVPQGRNPLATGLFAHAWLNLAARTDLLADNPWEADYCIAEAENLLRRLAAHVSPWTPAPADLLEAFEVKADLSPREPRLEGVGWGYHAPLQKGDLFMPRHYPDRVTTSWVGMAFLRAFQLTGDEKYRLAVRELSRFLLQNPMALYEERDQLCLSDVPSERVKQTGLEVCALTAAVVSGRVRIDPDSAAEAEKAKQLAQFVADRQNPAGSWPARFPVPASASSAGNAATAAVLAGLADTMTNLQTFTWLDAFHEGLETYRETQFTREGAPKRGPDHSGPHEIRAAALGILTFRRAAVFLREEVPNPAPEAAAKASGMAERITEWTLRNLYSGQGWFYFQQNGMRTKKICLIDRGNPWMCRALTEAG